MPVDATVSTWIKGLKQGDHEAVERLWVRYFEQLVVVANKRLSAARTRAYDAEDVALSVFASLCRGAENGNFQRLSTRDDLWALLIVLTRQKAVDRIRHENRKRRGGGKLRGESVMTSRGDRSSVLEVRDFISKKPTPESIVLLREQYEHLMNCLPNDTLRAIAVLRLEGYLVKEIAAKFGYTTRWAERKLELIRHNWEAELSK